MAWETRRQRRYYYRKQRNGARVKSIYLGAGLPATLAAQQDQATSRLRKQKSAKSADKAPISDTDPELDALIQSYTRLVNHVAAAVLLLNGFHQHKRQWRLHRVRQPNRQPP